MTMVVVKCQMDNDVCKLWMIGIASVFSAVKLCHLPCCLILLLVVAVKDSGRRMVNILLSDQASIHHC